MKKRTIMKTLTLLFSAIFLTLSLSGCRMNLPDVSGIGPKDKANEEAGEANADSDELDDMLFDDTDGNTDVTAGEVEDGSYYASALVKGETYFYVEAVEAVLKDKEAKKPSKIKDKSGDLNKARLAYLTSYYEGDEASAKEDLAEYEVYPVTDAQLKTIKDYSEDLGKVFAQFDITNYDLSAPNDSDEGYITYDVYSSDNEPFTLEFSFEEDTITEISFTYDGELE